MFKLFVWRLKLLTFLPPNFIEKDNHWSLRQTSADRISVMEWNGPQTESRWVGTIGGRGLCDSSSLLPSEWGGRSRGPRRAPEGVFKDGFTCIVCFWKSRWTVWWSWGETSKLSPQLNLLGFNMLSDAAERLWKCLCAPFNFVTEWSLSEPGAVRSYTQWDGGWWTCLSASSSLLLWHHHAALCRQADHVTSLCTWNGNTVSSSFLSASITCHQGPLPPFRAGCHIDVTAAAMMPLKQRLNGYRKMEQKEYRWREDGWSCITF